MQTHINHVHIRGTWTLTCALNSRLSNMVLMLKRKEHKNAFLCRLFLLSVIYYSGCEGGEEISISEIHICKNNFLKFQTNLWRN